MRKQLMHRYEAAATLIQMYNSDLTPLLHILQLLPGYTVHVFRTSKKDYSVSLYCIKVYLNV